MDKDRFEFEYKQGSRVDELALEPKKLLGFRLFGLTKLEKQ